MSPQSERAAGRPPQRGRPAANGGRGPAGSGGQGQAGSGGRGQAGSGGRGQAGSGRPDSRTGGGRAGRERRRASHSLDSVLTEAVALLDESGEQALTFRALAARLGGGVASIYWYVSSRDELLDREILPLGDRLRLYYFAGMVGVPWGPEGPLDVPG